MEFSKISRRMFKSIFAYGVMLFVIFISIGPLLWIVLSSFKTNMEILGSALSWPSKFSFAAYRDAIEASNLHRFFVNSLLVSGSATVLALFIYAMAAYVLARVEFRLRNAIFMLLSLSILVPVIAMVQPIFKIVNELNLYDTKTALIIVNTAIGMPVSLFLLRNFFNSIPKELEEAAYLEGSGFFNTFLKIMLPLARPALASAGILVFLNTWNEFLFALLLTGSPETRTLPLSLNYFVKALTYDYAALFAAVTMTILPSILIYVILQEQISKSLAGGAVKG
ncbi:carbohydrate ABC transporter permease [Paenibacillaceae bacterium WGS1546]|uniref:carbohydrate ABC transporter permease n=1 Tax=Cohnella sp. WGS1546 TaxID=3366810 RepID=UPI00372D8100